MGRTKEPWIFDIRFRNETASGITSIRADKGATFSFQDKTTNREIAIFVPLDRIEELTAILKNRMAEPEPFYSPSSATPKVQAKVVSEGE